MYFNAALDFAASKVGGLVALAYDGETGHRVELEDGECASIQAAQGRRSCAIRRRGLPRLETHSRCQGRDCHLRPPPRQLCGRGASAEPCCARACSCARTCQERQTVSAEERPSRGQATGAERTWSLATCSRCARAAAARCSSDRCASQGQSSGAEGTRAGRRCCTCCSSATACRSSSAALSRPLDVCVICIVVVVLVIIVRLKPRAKRGCS
jgi:hypothetical protein